MDGFGAFWRGKYAAGKGGIYSFCPWKDRQRPPEEFLNVMLDSDG